MITTDSGQTIEGVDGWKHITLGDIASEPNCLIQTGPFGSQLHKHEYQDHGVGVVNPTHLSDNRIAHEGVPHVSNETANRLERHRLAPGDILFARRGEIGRHGLVSEAENGWLCGTGCFLVRIRRDDVNNHFLSFFLTTRETVDWLNRHAAGVVMPNLSNSVLHRVPIALPPLAEQRKIAGVLGLVQRALEQQERLIALTTELKKALLHQLFTQGLRGEPQKQTEIGPVPESWEVVTLGSLAKVGNGSTPKRDNKGYWQGGTIAWLNSTKIHERFITQADQFVTDLAIKECHLPRVKPGSLLVAITGQGKTLGNTALISFETCINQHLAYAQFTTPRVVPEFVLWFMQTRYDHLRSISQAGGSTKGALTCGYLKTYPVPALDEQHEIADVFAALDRKEKVHQCKHAALTALFRTLLHQLMTAQLRVVDLDLPDLESM